MVWFLLRVQEVAGSIPASDHLLVLFLNIRNYYYMLLLYSILLYSKFKILIYTSFVLSKSSSKIFEATSGVWTRDLLLTKQLPYHLAIVALVETSTACATKKEPWPNQIFTNNTALTDKQNYTVSDSTWTTLPRKRKKKEANSGDWTRDLLLTKQVLCH